MNRFEKMSIIVFVSVAAIILYMLWERKHNVVINATDDQTPYNYYNGIPQMTSTGIPTITIPQSNAESPTITINSNSHGSGNTGCGCGCGVSGGESSLTTLSNFLQSINPDNGIEYVNNVVPIVHTSPAQIQAPVQQGYSLSFNTVF